jgi:[acyl-carrier-protein] S-malonyltransferase
VARIATVAGRPISAARLDDRLTELRRGPRGRHLPPGAGGDTLQARRWLLRELVTEAILVHEARAAGLDDAPETVAAVVFDRVTADVTVPEAELRAYYERNRDLYRRDEARMVRHVLVNTESMALRAAARIRAGEEMAAVAWELSRDRGSRTLGGDLGALRRGEFAGPLEEAVFAATIGQLLGPIRTDHGWHVARVERIVPGRMLAYTEVKAEIEEELLEAARSKAFDSWLERRRQALAVIEPAHEHPGHPVHGLVRHRH